MQGISQQGSNAKRPSEASLRLKARLAALFQLREAAAVFGQNYVGVFVVTGDPATTATRILADPSVLASTFGPDGRLRSHRVRSASLPRTVRRGYARSTVEMLK